ncbi:hypothetical protein FRC17_003509 [Serendipita sp. 399]|nr:hypothetical protein FRC17_003509 [Serendipita sp. 399]
MDQSPVTKRRRKTIESPTVSSSGDMSQDVDSEELSIYYGAEGVTRTITKPTTLDELFTMARQLFPIPPSVGFVAIDSTDWVVLSSEEWTLRRGTIANVSINLIHAGPPNESPSEYPIFALNAKSTVTYPIIARPSDSIERIISETARKLGEPSDGIKLTYRGIELDPTKTVEEYGIRTHETVRVHPVADSGESSDGASGPLDSRQTFTRPRTRGAPRPPVRGVRGVRGIRRPWRKPVIYVYSPSPSRVHLSLRLIPSWSFSAIYPVKEVKKTAQGEVVEWNVTTKEDGTLIDVETEVEIAYLYWEALSNPRSRKDVTPPNSRPSTPPSDALLEVFEPEKPAIVNQNSVVFSILQIPKYLDEVLLALGLHTEARTSFITFWLPDMLKYPSIALRFLPQTVYEKAAPLTVQPTPTMTTRIFMIWRGISSDEMGEDGPWAEAILRGKTTDLREWRDIVGTTGVVLKDEKDGLRVLEWGGMEDVLELARKFPIPPSVEFVAVDSRAGEGDIITLETWKSKRLEIPTVDIFPLVISAPDGFSADFPVTVKALGGKNFSITTNSIHTVARMVLEIESVIGLPFWSCVVVWKGQKLQLGDSIAQHGIKKNDTVHVVLRLRGK